LICVDASVAAKWLFEEEHSAQADLLLRTALEQRQPIIAPPLLLSEVLNIIRQRIRQGGLTLDEGQALLAQFLAIPISRQVPEALYGRALAIADEHNLPAVYDAHYVALAETLQATLWTADQRLLRALGNRRPFVRWLGDYHR